MAPAIKATSRSWRINANGALPQGAPPIVFTSPTEARNALTDRRVDVSLLSEVQTDIVQSAFASSDVEEVKLCAPGIDLWFRSPTHGSRPPEAVERVALLADRL